MAVYYYNGDKILAPFKIVSNKPVFASDTVSLKHIRASQRSQRWELSFNTLSKETTADAFIGILSDMDSKSSMVMPQFPEVYNSTTADGIIFVSNNYADNTSVLELDASSATGILPKGSFITFSNHSKVYVVKEEVDFSSSAATISIYPPLVSSVNGGTQINYLNNCLIQYYRDINNMQGVTFSDGILANQGTVTLIEAL